MNVKVLDSSIAGSILTELRKKETDSGRFKLLAHKLSLLLLAEALKSLPVREVELETPVSAGLGVSLKCEVTFVAILRAGLSMIPAAVELFPRGRLGFLGIYRNEETLKPVLYYAKLPVIKDGFYFLLDPMLATGGTAEMAVDFLLSRGISEERVKFVSFVSAPEGLGRLEKFKELEILTASIDEKLNDCGYIVPGLGDAGDRFCGTEEVEVFESHGF